MTAKPDRRHSWGILIGVLIFVASSFVLSLFQVPLMPKLDEPVINSSVPVCVTGTPTFVFSSRATEVRANPAAAYSAATITTSTLFNSSYVVAGTATALRNGDPNCGEIVKLDPKKVKE